MYGIIINVRIEPNLEVEARAMLNNMVVPRAKTHEGMTAGYWLLELGRDHLTSIQVYDTETNANKIADRIRTEGPPPGAPVSLVSVKTYEIIAQV